MEKLNGIVEKVNHQYNTGGICLAGKWYNGVDEKVGSFVTKVKKGDNVEIKVNGNKIQFLNNLSYSPQENPNDNNFPVEKVGVSNVVVNNVVKNDVGMEAVVKVNGKIMEKCKEEVDRIFGNDKRYEPFLGRHCNSLFIQVCKMYC